MYKFIIVIISLAMSSTAYAQGADSDGTAAGAVERWLTALDQEDYETTWQQSAPIFRNKISMKKWRKAARSARKPFGDFESRELLGAAYQHKLPGVPQGDYVIFQFRSKFSKKDGAIETITPMLVDGIWQVSGYYIR